VDIQVQDEIDCKVVVGNGAREKDKLSVER